MEAVIGKPVRPAIVKDEHLSYLDGLRKSGKVNMFGAGPYLQKRFRNLDRDEVRDVLLYWMRSFGERHPARATGA